METDETTGAASWRNTLKRVFQHPQAIALPTRIGVRTLNEAKLFYDASVQPHGEPDISLHVTLNRHGADEEIDRQLVKLFNVASEWDVNPR